MILVFILFFIIFILAILEAFTNNKLTKNIFFVLSSFFVIFSLAFNRWSHDYANYLKRYESSTIIKEKGFIILREYIEKYSPYKGHEMILIIISILVFLFFYKIKSKDLNMSFIIFLYSIYPLTLDINQTKNLYMYIFFYFAFMSLIKQKNIIFLFFNFLGMQFHRVGILYFPIYFFRKCSKNLAYKIFFLIFISMFFFTDFIIGIANIYYGDKLGLYIRKEASLAPYFYLIMILLDWLLIYFIDKKYNRILKNTELNFYSIVLIYPLVYVPFFFYVGNITRIYRNLFLLKYIFYSKIIYRVNTKDKIIITFYALFISSINLLLYLISSPEFLFFRLFLENKIIYFFKNFI